MQIEGAYKLAKAFYMYLHAGGVVLKEPQNNNSSGESREELNHEPVADKNKTAEQDLLGKKVRDVLTLEEEAFILAVLHSCLEHGGQHKENDKDELSPSSSNLTTSQLWEATIVFDMCQLLGRQESQAESSSIIFETITVGESSSLRNQKLKSEKAAVVEMAEEQSPSTPLKRGAQHDSFSSASTPTTEEKSKRLLRSSSPSSRSLRPRRKRGGKTI
jgi:hypothetical protein